MLNGLQHIFFICLYGFFHKRVMSVRQLAGYAALAVSILMVLVPSADANTPFTNTAVFSYNTGAISTSTVVVSKEDPTPSAIEFLQYAPSSSSAAYVQVTTTDVSTDGTTGSTVPISNIYQVGSATPIDLSNPVPLVSSSVFHQGDPVFLQLSDPDEDTDPSAIDSIWVTITVNATGESELIRMYETGVNTGVFAGYIQSSNSAAPAANNGTLEVDETMTVTASYTDASDNTDTAQTSVLVDPYGVVFDSSTGSAVDNAVLTLINTDTGNPAAVFGDDGLSTFPSTIISGGTATDSSGAVYTFPAGNFRFPFVAAGNYRIVVTPPSGYQAPSAVATAALQALPNAPFAIAEPGSRGEIFVINPGPSVRMDIPIDVVSGTLWLKKTASKDTVAIGDFLYYTLTLENTDSSPSTGIVVSDRLPTGFRYQAGSTRIDSVKSADPLVSADGRTLSFSIASLAANTGINIQYVVEVGAGARLGKAVNTANATDSAANASNAASATVTVKEDLFRSKNTIVGRVIADNSNDITTNEADGVKGVRIFLEDGTYVDTDENGMFHFEGVASGVHVVQLDKESLPEIYTPYLCENNTRFSGTPWSRFVDLKGGVLWRADFHVRLKPGMKKPAAAPDAPLKDKNRATSDSIADIGRDTKKIGPEKPLVPIQDGFLSPLADALLPNPINAVRICLDAKLKPELLLDGKPVSHKKIGFKLNNKETGKTLYTFIGLNFGKAGPHTLTLNGKGPFGNNRFSHKINIVRTGEIAEIKLVEAAGNIADGKTPVQLRIQLNDASGRAIKAPFELTLKDGNLKVVEKRDTVLTDTTTDQNRVRVDAAGYVRFAPVNKSGKYRTVLAYNDIEAEFETYVSPKLRDWIIVGLAQGSAGYNTVSGNMENLDASDAEDKFYKDGRVAFYAKGKIKGKWLLTLAYDSEKDKDDPDTALFNTIDPDSYYTLYGDNTRQQYDASSVRNLYVKMEREGFYALFGDFATDLAVTELSKYTRSLNGLKTEYSSDKFSFNGFVSDTNQAYVKDEIRGDGTSGLYTLSRKNIVINSEKITIETRNQYHSQEILSSETMSRHVDYNIDYDAGTLFFKSPVYSKDTGFNPVYIVVEYESDDEADQSFTYGGRGAVNLMDGKFEAGATYIHEGGKNREGDLAGVDAVVYLGKGLKLKGEVAASVKDEKGEKNRGRAYIAELEKKSGHYTAKAYIRQQDKDFGLNQQNAGESGTRKYGVEGDVKVRKDILLSAAAYRQSNLETDAKQDVGEAKLSYLKELYSLYTGMRYAQDRLGDGSADRSTQLRFGGKRKFDAIPLQLRIDHEQAVFNKNDSDDFPTRTLLGADYQLSDTIALFGEQEFKWGENEDTFSTRAGIKASPWSGGQVSTSMEREYGENSERLFANMGLAQLWKINSKWSLDAGLDQTHTLRDKGLSSVNDSDDDFTALSFGAAYDEAIWSWAGRVETRFADTEDKWSLTTGMVIEPKAGLGLSAGVKLIQSETAAGARDRSGDIRLGLAWRPKNTKWIILDRMDFVWDRQTGNGVDTAGRRIINNLNANYKPGHKLQMAFQYGAKYVTDTIDNDRYCGFTDLLGIETRYDITEKWDVGARASVLHSWNAGQMDYSSGVSVGYSFVKNVWVSLGYNFIGFEDEDFSNGSYTAQGPFVRFRIKFDQETVKDAVNWFGGKRK